MALVAPWRFFLSNYLSTSNKGHPLFFPHQILPLHTESLCNGWSESKQILLLLSWSAQWGAITPRQQPAVHNGHIHKVKKKTGNSTFWTWCGATQCRNILYRLMMLGNFTDTFLFGFLSHRSMMEMGRAQAKVLATITPLFSTTRKPMLSTTACYSLNASLSFFFISKSALELQPRKWFCCMAPCADPKRKTSCTEVVNIFMDN